MSHHISKADNWNGSITAKLQSDNRYTNDANFFAEALGRFEYDSSRYDLHAGLDLYLRGGTYSFDNRAEFYQLFLQKNFRSLNSSVKVGRFQHADSIGLYTLNGADIQYRAPNDRFIINLYGGVPERFDDLKSLKGNSLLGFTSAIHLAPQTHSRFIPLSLDILDLRIGYQRFNGEDNLFRFSYLQNNERNQDVISHKISFGLNTEGRVLSSCCKSYEARILGTYQVNTNTMEDLLAEGQFDFSDTLRLRTSYEYYRPDREDNPTFREQFYFNYGFGKQTILRASMHQEPFPGIDYFLGGIRTTREVGDPGYGGSAGVNISRWGDLELSGEIEYISLHEDRIASLFLRADYAISSRQNIQLSTALRNEKKQLYDDNSVKGFETRWNYMLKNNILLAMTANYIWNSRLSDEYLGSMQITYYFDNFKPKQAK